ncbi:hypothetical protein PT2222_100181 [Paraburkholderia tropica]
MKWSIRLAARPPPPGRASRNLRAAGISRQAFRSRFFDLQRGVPFPARARLQVALDRLEQFLQQGDVERLREHAHVHVTRALQFLRVTGDENHGQRRLAVLQRLGQIDAVHLAGHVDVREHKIEMREGRRVVVVRRSNVAGLDERERARRVVRAGDVMAHHLQQRFGARRDFVVVFDQQHAQAVRRRDAVLARRRFVRDRRRGRGARQIQMHRRARADRAVDRGQSARALAEREHLRQPEPRAHALRLGRIERLERAREHVGRHADARILQRNVHEFAVERKALAGPERDIARAHREAAAVGHGVARVDGEIDEREFEFGDVDVHGPHAFVDIDDERDLRAQRRAQQFAARGQPASGVDRLVAQRLLARHAEQLARERLAALERALDRREFAFERGRAAPPRDLHVGGDDHQQIVEVVRDAADEIAERFHLARLPVGRFDRAPHRRFGLPALPRFLFGGEAAQRQPDHAPERDRRREHRDDQHAQVPVPRGPDRRAAVRAGDINRIRADTSIREDHLVVEQLRAHVHDARVLAAGECRGERRARRNARTAGARLSRGRRRLERENRAVAAHEAERHRRVRAQQFAIEGAEVGGPQRDRNETVELALRVVARHARVEHDFAAHLALHHARDVIDHAARADAHEVVAREDRDGRRRRVAAAREQVAVAAEDRHGRHLRIAAADRVELLVNLRFVQADAFVVEILHAVHDARVERVVHVEHLERVLLGHAHGAQRDVGGVGFARAQVVPRHRGHVDARQHDGRHEQRNQRAAADREVVAGRGRKRRFIGARRSGRAIVWPGGPVGNHRTD